MHVAIKQTILDKILKRIHEIKRDNREPEYIVVTPEEYCELRGDRRVYGYLNSDRYVCPPSEPVADLCVDTREFKLRDKHLGWLGARPFLRTYSREKFMGLPLYVVPSEYMPA
ncbi:hypothetical protein [Achromobacter sp. DH1f]|uniref:hypothetical protein n=1 Tax=Achromobacter sp. DH1f TaxID=1397275 RepID=UPI000468620B|nr:hypothetical protein [Achromobacter sp. DH1f]